MQTDPGQVDPRRSSKKKKKDRAVMQEIYFWDHEEILEKSTTIVVYFDVGQQIRSGEGREEKRGEIFRQVLSDFN